MNLGSHQAETKLAESAYLITMAGPRKTIFERNDVACPYFMPVERLENGNWPHPARLPLGGGWSGHCTAPGHEGELPPQHILEAFCNLGYVDCCSWAPRERAWDAVRFAVSAPQSSKAGRDIPGRFIQLRYACERDHRPVEDGSLQFDLSSGVWIDRHNDCRLQKMAECFLENYLKKKS